jgi:hypothetical protein
MIVKRKDGYHVISEKSSKNLGGPYATHEAAVHRLQQIEYFKHKGKSAQMTKAEQIMEKIALTLLRDLPVERLEAAAESAKKVGIKIFKKENGRIYYELPKKINVPTSANDLYGFLHKKQIYDAPGFSKKAGA